MISISKEDASTGTLVRTSLFTILFGWLATFAVPTLAASSFPLPSGEALVLDLGNPNEFRFTSGATTTTQAVESVSRSDCSLAIPEGDLVHVTIDGREAMVERDTTILQAATDLSIEIPTLCHHPALEPYGACRLCTVEVIDQGRSRLVTSCNYPIRREIEVLTASEKVVRGRRMIVELLWARCPEAAVFQELGARYGIKKPRFEMRDGDVSVREVPWAKQGDAVAWLVSDVFGLKQARSKDAERAVEAAEAFMRGDEAALPEGLNTQEAIHHELLRLLPGHDPFWPRWVVHAKETGP